MFYIHSSGSSNRILKLGFKTYLEYMWPVMVEELIWPKTFHFHKSSLRNAGRDVVYEVLPFYVPVPTYLWNF